MKTTEQVIDSIDEVLEPPVIGCPTIHSPNQRVLKDFSSRTHYEQSIPAEIVAQMYPLQENYEAWPILLDIIKSDADQIGYKEDPNEGVIILRYKSKTGPKPLFLFSRWKNNQEDYTIEEVKLETLHNIDNRIPIFQTVKGFKLWALSQIRSTLLAERLNHENN